MASFILTTASLVAYALAQGSANVQNHCGTTVYYKTKIPGMSNSVQSFGPNDSPLSFPYPAAGAAGWNVLFSPDQDAVQSEQDVSQLEITQSAATGGAYSAEGKIWYDLSNVNSSAAGMAKAVTTYPFAQWGFTLSSNQQGCGNGAPNNCQSCGCEAGQHDCTDAYQYWNDDARAMHDTTPESDITLSLCMPIGGSSASSGSGSSSPASSAGYSSAASSATAPPAGYGSSSSQGSQTTLQTQYTASPSTLGYANFKPAASAVSAVESQVGGAVTTTVVSDAVVTQYVKPGKRHLHQHQHAHHHAHHQE